MAVPFPPLASARNGQIKVPLAPLVANAIEETYLTADMAVGTAMTVKSTLGFHATTNQPLVIGALGGEITELAETTTSTAPATLTLAATSVYAHKTGDPVYLIKFDQIEFSHATTLAGTKTVLTANSGLYSIQPDKPEFILDETEFTSGFYFVRYKESVGGTFSDYSDGIEVGVWERETVGFMIGQALRNLELELSSKITIADCYEWVNKCMKQIQGKLKRWPEHYKYDYVAGQTTRGIHTLTLPTDIYDTETNKSIIGFRIGNNPNLTYLPPREFDLQQKDTAQTQVRTEVAVSAITIEVDNSYDFSDTGSVSFYISGTKYTTTYTGVTRSATAGVLTGIPGVGEDNAITVTVPVDTNIWQLETEGIPTWFTIRNSQAEFWPLADGNEDDQNITLDYSLVATIVDSDGDAIDYQRYDMIQSYLTWRIKMKAKNNGELDMKDGYYLEYREGLMDAIRTLANNNPMKMRPNINRMYKRAPYPAKADLQDLSISEQ